MNKRVLLNVSLAVGTLALAGCATSPPITARQSVPLGLDLGGSGPVAAIPQTAPVAGHGMHHTGSPERTMLER